MSYLPLPNPLPVSGTVTSSVSNFPATQAVSIASMPTTPVTGTFWQATQPVSGTVGISGTVPVSGPLTDAQLRASAVLVSGTFWQATQPVSGTVSVSGSVAVTGTFWQATQPVSGTVTVGNSSLAVTGTFWPTTQPVSGAVAATGVESIVDGLGFNALTDGSGSPRPLSTMSILYTGSAYVVSRGDSTSGQWVNVKAVPALTKGTQGSTGLSVQNLKDAGRTAFSTATVIAGVTAVTTEALVTMVPVRAGVAAATATSHAVTSGKTLRITRITVGFISTAAAVLSMRFALRTNPSGAVVATSPILQIFPLSSGAALAQAGNQMTIEFPDGIEFSGTHQFGITQIGSVATGTCWVSVAGFEY